MSLTSLTKSQVGASLIEAALVLPLLLGLAINIIPFLYPLQNHRGAELAASITSQFLWKRCGAVFLESIDQSILDDDGNEIIQIPDECGNNSQLSKEITELVTTLLPSDSSAEWAVTVFSLDTSTMKVNLEQHAASPGGTTLTIFPTKEKHNPDGTTEIVFDKKLSLNEFETLTQMTGILNPTNRVVIGVEYWFLGVKGKKLGVLYEGISVF